MGKEQDELRTAVGLDADGRAVEGDARDFGCLLADRRIAGTVDEARQCRAGHLGRARDRRRCAGSAAARCGRGAALAEHDRGNSRSDDDQPGDAEQQRRGARTPGRRWWRRRSARGPLRGHRALPSGVGSRSKASAGSGARAIASSARISRNADNARYGIVTKPSWRNQITVHGEIAEQHARVERGEQLEGVVVGREHRTDHRERRDIPANTDVAMTRRDPQDDDQRVHRDPLVPAQLAGLEVGDLGEVQAAGHRQRGDDERPDQRDRFDGRPCRVEPTARGRRTPPVRARAPAGR